MNTETPLLNGVDTEALFATIGVVGDQRDLAAFQFRASSTWISGTHSQSTIEGFYGAGGEQQHHRAFTFDADHPAVLTGDDINAYCAVTDPVFDVIVAGAEEWASMIRWRPNWQEEFYGGA